MLWYADARNRSAERRDPPAPPDRRDQGRTRAKRKGRSGTGQLSHSECLKMGRNIDRGGALVQKRVKRESMNKPRLYLVSRQQPVDTPQCSPQSSDGLTIDAQANEGHDLRRGQYPEQVYVSIRRAAGRAQLSTDCWLPGRGAYVAIATPRCRTSWLEHPCSDSADQPSCCSDHAPSSSREASRLATSPDETGCLNGRGSAQTVTHREATADDQPRWRPSEAAPQLRLAAIRHAWAGACAPGSGPDLVMSR